MVFHQKLVSTIVVIITKCLSYVSGLYYYVACDDMKTRKLTCLILVGNRAYSVCVSLWPLLSCF